MARRVAVLLPSLMALACTRSGEVVVVLDSTMRAGAVEVVAYPLDATADTGAPGKTTTGTSPNVDDSRTRALDDSADALAARFRTVRDSLNDEVAALAKVDRRSRTYAVRYAEIRRRTLAAEQIRAQRDSARARASAIRSSNSVGSTTVASGVGGGGAAPAPRLDDARTRRYAVRDSAVTLALAPGRWSIGATSRGSVPVHWARVTVARGSHDTLRLSISGAPGDTP